MHSTWVMAQVVAIRHLLCSRPWYLQASSSASSFQLKDLRRFWLSHSDLGSQARVPLRLKVLETHCIHDLHARQGLRMPVWFFQHVHVVSVIIETSSTKALSALNWQLSDICFGTINRQDWRHVCISPSGQLHVLLQSQTHNLTSRKSFWIA